MYYGVRNTLIRAHARALVLKHLNDLILWLLQQGTLKYGANNVHISQNGTESKSQ